MRRLALPMQVSVAGLVVGPNGELDWVVGSLRDDATAWIVDRLWLAGVHIVGRRTGLQPAAAVACGSRPARPARLGP
jgi:hypothetical protein